MVLVQLRFVFLLQFFEVAVQLVVPGEENGGLKDQRRGRDEEVDNGEVLEVGRGRDHVRRRIAGYGAAVVTIDEGTRVRWQDSALHFSQLVQQWLIASLVTSVFMLSLTFDALLLWPAAS